MIQQKVGFGTVLETAYVFNLSKHIPIARQLNAVPLYSQYNPANDNPNVALSASQYQRQDPQRTIISARWPGLGALRTVDFSGNASYNSLQVTVRRNFTRRLSYGLAYTFSKTMSAFGSTASGYPYTNTQSPYFPDKFRNYGPSYQPTPHVASSITSTKCQTWGRSSTSNRWAGLRTIGPFPASRRLRSDIRVGVPGHLLLRDHFHQPANELDRGIRRAPGCSSWGTRSFPRARSRSPAALRWFKPPAPTPTGRPAIRLLNEGVFVIPNPCSWTPGPTPQQGVGQSMSCFGNAGAGSLIPIPGTRIFNWDMTFSKAFPLKGEKRQIMFRAEMYNIFNHTQFTAANIAPQYNWPLWQTGVLQQTNANLGRYTAAANPRQMSLSLRVQF